MYNCKFVKITRWFNSSQMWSPNQNPWSWRFYLVAGAPSPSPAGARLTRSTSTVSWPSAAAPGAEEAGPRGACEARPRGSRGELPCYPSPHKAATSLPAPPRPPPRPPRHPEHDKRARGWCLKSKEAAVRTKESTSWSVMDAFHSSKQKVYTEGARKGIGCRVCHLAEKVTLG
jgi:hypothetical protein